MEQWRSGWNTAGSQNIYHGYTCFTGGLLCSLNSGPYLFNILLFRYLFQWFWWASLSTCCWCSLSRCFLLCLFANFNQTWQHHCIKDKKHHCVKDNHFCCLLSGQIMSISTKLSNTLIKCHISPHAKGEHEKNENKFGQFQPNIFGCLLREIP